MEQSYIELVEEGTEEEIEEIKRQLLEWYDDLQLKEKEEETVESIYEEGEEEPTDLEKMFPDAEYVVYYSWGGDENEKDKSLV